MDPVSTTRPLTTQTSTSAQPEATATGPPTAVVCAEPPTTTAAPTAAAGTIPPLSGGAGGDIDALLARADSATKALDDRIKKLGDDPSQADLLRLQRDMQKVQQLFELASQMIRSRHDAILASIRNIA